VANNFISKTAFLKFEQCSKAFFLYKNHYYLRDKPSVDKQLTFKRGHDIGFLAQQLFPGGINIVEHDSNKERAVAYTKQLIENKTSVIYEATFVFEGILVMVDILVLTDNGYLAYEVKSSLKVSETYIKDACLQYYVVKNCVPKLNDFFIVTLNEGYVFNETLQIKQLFKRRSILKDALKNEEYIQKKLVDAQFILEQNMIPNVNVGKQCFSPYECDFLNTCWKDKLGDKSIFMLGKMNKDDLFNWYNSGIKTIKDIPITNDLSKQVRIQIETNINEDAYLDVPAVKTILANIKKPYAAFDMEIWGQPVPVLNGTKPFQKIPFLFTLFSESGVQDFFMEYELDDRRKFAVSLIEHTNKFASLLVYDKSLESIIIRDLTDLFADLSEDLKKVSKKLVDISEIIQHQYYYHHLFKGNYSLKTVSKVILKEDVFEQQAIHTGLEAMNAFVSYRIEDNLFEKQKLKDDLITYCSADTKATYFITEKFIELVS